MADSTTYIKLDRNILRWRWWNDHNTLVVFLTLLLEANIADNGFSGITVHRGEVATSLSSLCKITGLSIRKIRTSILHLKSTGEVTVTKYPRFTVITVVNYDRYQKATWKTTEKVTSKRQASDKVATTIKEYKEIKNGRNNNNPPTPHRGESPSGGKQYDNLHAETMMPRDVGTYDDIPSVYRDGTYQSFKTWQEYWDWSNQ